MTMIDLEHKKARERFISTVASNLDQRGIRQWSPQFLRLKFGWFYEVSNSIIAYQAKNFPKTAHPLVTNPSGGAASNWGRRAWELTIRTDDAQDLAEDLTQLLLDGKPPEWPIYLWEPNALRLYLSVLGDFGLDDSRIEEFLKQPRWGRLNLLDPLLARTKLR